MNPTKQELIAYFSGSLPPGRRQHIEDWLSGQPDEQLVEEALQAAIDPFLHTDKEVSDEAPDNAPVSDRIRSAAATTPEKTLQAYARFRELTADPTIRKPARRVALIRYSSVAAAVLLFLLAGIEWYRHNLPSRDRNTQALAPAHQQHYYAARAAITRIALSDGSIVHLFPGSVLTLNDSFNRRNRTVELQGRGFFEVAHNTALPFSVRSGTLTTRVLATSFDIDMDEKNETRIVVKEGKVQVTETDSVLSTLIPGQGIAVNALSGKWKLQAVDAEDYCSWTKGQLGFRQTQLQDILPELGKWFNVSFRIQQPRLLHKKLTFFIRRQGLKEAMDILSTAGDFRYEIKSDTITLK